MQKEKKKNVATQKKIYIVTKQILIRASLTFDINRLKSYQNYIKKEKKHFGVCSVDVQLCYCIVFSKSLKALETLVWFYEKTKRKIKSPFVCLFVCLFVDLFLCLSVCLSACLFVCSSFRLSANYVVVMDSWKSQKSKVPKASLFGKLIKIDQNWSIMKKKLLQKLTLKYLEKNTVRAA